MKTINGLKRNRQKLKKRKCDLHETNKCAYQLLYSVLAAYSVINQQQSKNKINDQNGVISWWNIQ